MTNLNDIFELYQEYYNLLTELIENLDKVRFSENEFIFNNLRLNENIFLMERNLFIFERLNHLDSLVTNLIGDNEELKDLCKRSSVLLSEEKYEELSIIVEKIKQFK